MNKVVVAFAPVKSPKFAPIYAELPIAESVVEAYIEHDDKSLVSAARVLLGIPDDVSVVSGVFIDADDGIDITEFFAGLKSRWEKYRCTYAIGKAHGKLAANLLGGVTRTTAEHKDRPIARACHAEIPPELVALLKHLAYC